MKKLIYIVPVLLCLLLAGCWSRREVEDLGIVSALGIDVIKVQDQEKIKLSTIIVRPPQLGGTSQSGGGVERNPGWLVSDVGNSLYDAERNISRRSPRPLVMYHNDVVVIGEKAAGKKLPSILDFLMRHKDLRLRNWVLISKVEALKVLQSMPEGEQTISEEVHELLTKTNPRTSESYPVDLNTFTQALITPGMDAIAPVVNVFSPKESAVNQRGEKEPEQTISIGGLAVFKKDKFAGFLTPVEVKGALYIMGKAQGGIIPVGISDKQNKKVSFMMLRSSSEIKPVIKQGKLIIEIKIKAEANVAEVDGMISVQKPKVLNQLEKRFNECVTNLAEDSLEKVQKKYKADIFGFGDKIHKTYPEYWQEIEKDWSDIYPDLPVVIRVEGHLIGTSVIGKPFEIR